MIIVKIYLYAGVILLGCSAGLQYFLYLRLRDAGRNYIFFNWLATVLSDYLKLRSRHGWPRWPAYLVILTLILGLVLLVIAVEKLSHV